MDNPRYVTRIVTVTVTTEIRRESRIHEKSLPSSFTAIKLNPI